MEQENVIKELTEEEKRDQEILQYYAEGGHYKGSFLTLNALSRKTSAILHH